MYRLDVWRKWWNEKCKVIWDLSMEMTVKWSVSEERKLELTIEKLKGNEEMLWQGVRTFWNLRWMLNSNNDVDYDLSYHHLLFFLPSKHMSCFPSPSLSFPSHPLFRTPPVPATSLPPRSHTLFPFPCPFN